RSRCVLCNPSTAKLHGGDSLGVATITPIRRTRAMNPRSRGQARRSRLMRALNVEALEDRFLLSGGFGEFLVPTPRATPYGITAGSDGNVWFTEFYGKKIGRV